MSAFLWNRHRDRGLRVRGPRTCPGHRVEGAFPGHRGIGSLEELEVGACILRTKIRRPRGTLALCTGPHT